jgi:beta-lactamase class D
LVAGLVAVDRQATCGDTGSDPAALRGQLIEDPALAAILDRSGFAGSILVYDLQSNSYLAGHGARSAERFLPASTFKIPNSLIALETGVVADEHTVFRWDGAKRWVAEWNRDHDLASAFANSVVWYYQEVARKVGAKRMRHWLALARYGNADIGGGIDRFWLDGALRISEREQVDFLVRLYRGELPFSRRSQQIVKQIMVSEQTPSYTIRAKTGWAVRTDRQIGWWVGWVESGERVTFFATNIETAHPSPGFTPARLSITKEALRHLGVLPPTSEKPTP